MTSLFYYTKKGNVLKNSWWILDLAAPAYIKRKLDRSYAKEIFITFCIPVNTSILLLCCSFHTFYESAPVLMVLQQWDVIGMRRIGPSPIQVAAGRIPFVR